MPEDEALVKAERLPNSLTTMMQFFYRGNPRSDGSKIFADIRITHTEDSNDIISDIEFDLEIKDVPIGLQLLQHNDTVKVGHLFGIM